MCAVMACGRAAGSRGTLDFPIFGLGDRSVSELCNACFTYPVRRSALRLALARPYAERGNGCAVAHILRRIITGAGGRCAYGGGAAGLGLRLVAGTGGRLFAAAAHRDHDRESLRRE